MSKVLSTDDVKNVAKLSRLKLSDEEIAGYAQQLGSVLEYVEKLNELDLDGVEPLAQPSFANSTLKL